MDEKPRLPDVEDVVGKERLAEIKENAIVAGAVAMAIGVTPEVAAEIAVRQLRTQVINEYARRLPTTAAPARPAPRPPVVMRTATTLGRSCRAGEGWDPDAARNLRLRTRHHMPMV